MIYDLISIALALVIANLVFVISVSFATEKALFIAQTIFSVIVAIFCIIITICIVSSSGGLALSIAWICISLGQAAFAAVSIGRTY